MKRNTNMRKIANALFMLLISPSHGAGAMEEGVMKTSGEAPLTFKESLITRDGQVIATKTADAFPHSVSVSYTKGFPPAESARRHLLSLDGGGMRGIFPAAVLAFIEKIINHSVNDQSPGRLKKYYPDYLDLSNIFETMGGTSTGSIIAATLLHAAPSYRATDVLRLYVQYGYKIFDETARTTGNLVYAKYGPEGLKNLLAQYFHEGAIEDAVKEHTRLYIAVFDPSANGGTTLPFTNARPGLITDSYVDNSRQPLAGIVMASCAAPTFFPAVSMERGGKTVLMRDGGIGCTFPGYEVFKEESLQSPNCVFDLISLGTGSEPTDDQREEGTGDGGILTTISPLISDLFNAPTNNDINACKKTVYDTSSRLQSFFRFQPLLEKGGTNILDNTTRPYALSLIHHAFQLTQGEVFKRMIDYLGFTLPNETEMKGIYKEILRQLHSLSSGDYAKLTELEKEGIAKKILELDFDFYENCNVNNIDLTESQKTALLDQLVSDIDRDEGNAGYLHRLKDLIYPDKNYRLIEIIKRSLDFHKYSKDVGKLTLQDLNGIIENLEETNSAQILDALLLEFKGSRSRETYSAVIAASLRDGIDYAWSFWTMPADSRVNGYSCGLCGISDAYKYAGHNAPYIDLVAAIYWKDKLSQVEDDVTPEQLASFYKKIYGYFYGAPENDNGFWNYLPRVYVSRKDAFVTALGQYVKKRFLKENQL